MAFGVITLSSIIRVWAILDTPVPFSWAVLKKKLKTLSPPILTGTIEPGTEKWLIFWK